MSECKPLKCQKCGKPIGYVSFTAKTAFEPRPSELNIRLVGTCMDCKGRTGFYRPPS